MVWLTHADGYIWSLYFIVDDFGNDIDLWSLHDRVDEQAWLFAESEQPH
jgi:hypothetical protein